MRVLQGPEQLRAPDTKPVVQLATDEAEDPLASSGEPSTVSVSQMRCLSEVTPNFGKFNQAEMLSV